MNSTFPRYFYEESLKINSSKYCNSVLDRTDNYHFNEFVIDKPHNIVRATINATVLNILPSRYIQQHLISAPYFCCLFGRT